MLKRIVKDMCDALFMQSSGYILLADVGLRLWERYAKPKKASGGFVGQCVKELAALCWKFPVRR